MRLVLDRRLTVNFQPTRKSLPKLALALAATALAATFVPALAHDMNGHHGMHSAASGFWFGAPGKASEATRTVAIKANDLTFEPAALQVKPGETIRFVVTNASAFDHDFTLGDAPVQEAHRKEMVEMAGMMEMAAAHAHADPNAVFLKAGETKELVWKFGKAGTIEFDCNVPGHYDSGMKGTLAVK
jgi:uncharacterized cupredoxin-like copper-binding protein